MRKYAFALLVCLAVCSSARGQTPIVNLTTLTASGTSCATGSTTAGSFVIANTGGMGSAVFVVNANAGGNTLSFYASGDGGKTYTPLNVTQSNATSPVTSTSTTTAGASFQANVGAYTNVCILLSTQASGNSTVGINASTASARAGGSGGGLAPSTPGIPTANGNVFFASNYGALFDVLNPTGCSGTSGLSSLTCTGASFIATDVGKVIWESGSANSTADLPSTTISVVNSTTNVTVAGTFARNSSAGEAAYGHDDTTKINSVWGTLIGTGNCNASIHFPAGGTIFSSAIMSTVLPAKCAYDQFPNVPSITAEGFGATLFYPSPAFTFFSTSNCGSSTALYCFGPGRALMSDFGIYGGYGGGIFGSNTYNGTWIGVLTPGYLKRVQLSEISFPGNGQAVSLVTGTSSIETAYIFGLTGTGSGAACTALNAAASDSIISNVYVNSACQEDGANLTASGTNVNIYSVFGGCAVQNCILVTGGQTSIHGDFAGFGRKATGAGTILNLVGATNIQNAAAVTSLISAASGALVNICNSVYKNTAAGTNVAVTVDATSTVTDCGGSTLTANNGTASITSGGQFLPSPTSTYSGNTLTATFVPTGTGACASPSTLKGDLFAGSFVCPGTTGASTITFTPKTAAINGWQCSFKDITTPANVVNTTSAGTSSCTASASTITANDVITFSAVPF